MEIGYFRLPTTYFPAMEDLAGVFLKLSSTLSYTVKAIVELHHEVEELNHRV